MKTHGKAILPRKRFRFTIASIMNLFPYLSKTKSFSSPGHPQVLVKMPPYNLHKKAARLSRRPAHRPFAKPLPTKYKMPAVRQLPCHWILSTRKILTIWCRPPLTCTGTLTFFSITQASGVLDGLKSTIPTVIYRFAHQGQPHRTHASPVWCCRI